MSYDLNQMAREVHAGNVEKWWKDSVGNPIQRNRGELLMLVVTELAEATEGIRKGLMDDHLPKRTMEEVEMADALIRLLDYTAGFKLQLDRSHVVAHFAVWENKAEAMLEIVGAVYGIRARQHSGDRDQSAAVMLTITAIETYCQHNGLDLIGAYREKLAYNQTRKDHTHEARAQDGGKKF